MSFADLLEILNTVIFQLGDRPITLLQIFILPTLLIVGFLLIR